MSSSPLTHHEILALVEPFTRCGRHVDLAASNRLERRLVFKPVEHLQGGPETPVLRETLQLDKLVTSTFRLTRVLSLPGGPQGTLTALGTNPGALLASFLRVDPRQHFRCVAGVHIARSYEFHSEPGQGAAGVFTAPPVYTRGVAEMRALRATLTLPSTRGVAAEVTLETLPGDEPLELPEDLLAVLGWDWARLIPGRDGWKSKLRLRGGAARRSRGAEAALEMAVRHLTRTLAEPPGRFHDRWAAARWGVVLRRSIPVLTLVLLVAAIAVLPHFIVNPNPALRLLLYDVPTALIVLSFCLQELARYEIPPLPWRASATGWQRSGGPKLLASQSQSPAPPPHLAQPPSAAARSPTASTSAQPSSAAARSPTASTSAQPPSAAPRSPTASTSAQPSSAALRSPTAPTSAQLPSAAARSPTASTSAQPPSAAARSPTASTSAQPPSAAARSPTAPTSAQLPSAAARSPTASTSTQPSSAALRSPTASASSAESQSASTSTSTSSSRATGERSRWNVST